jgi:hypothetical protein
LLGRKIMQLPLGRKLRVFDQIKNRVINWLVVVSAHSEADAPNDLIHDCANGIDIVSKNIGLHCLIAATNVIADPRGRNMFAVCDCSADWLTVAQVIVCTQDCASTLLNCLATLDLSDCPVISLTEDGEAAT